MASAFEFAGGHGLKQGEGFAEQGKGGPTGVTEAVATKGSRQDGTDNDDMLIAFHVVHVGFHGGGFRE